MCTGQRHFEHEHFLLENQKIHSKERFWKLFFLENMMKLCWFGSCCFSAVSSWGGWVGACFLPARSLRPWACLHVGLISVLWTSFPFLSSTPLITVLCMSVLTLVHCRSFTPWFSVLGFLFPYPDYWTCLCLCPLPSDFGGKWCMAMICIS